MGVRVDHPRQDGHAGEIDDLRAGRDGDVAAHALDARSPDDDDLVGARRVGAAVDERAGFDVDGLRRGGRGGGEDEQCCQHGVDCS